MSSQFSRKRHHVDESFTKSDLWVERSVNYWTCNTSGHVTTTVRGRKQDLSATCRQDHNDATMTESQPSNTSGFFLNTFETNNLNQLQSSTSVVLVIGIDSGAGLGYPIMQVTWSGRVCTSSTGTAPQMLANNRVLRVSCASLATAQESRREQKEQSRAQF